MLTNVCFFFCLKQRSPMQWTRFGYIKSAVRKLLWALNDRNCGRGCRRKWLLTENAYINTNHILIFIYPQSCEYVSTDCLYLMLWISLFIFRIFLGAGDLVFLPTLWQRIRCCYRLVALLQWMDGWMVGVSAAGCQKGVCSVVSFVSYYSVFWQSFHKCISVRVCIWDFPFCF